MTELDTSAYRPAHEAEDEENTEINGGEEEQEIQRTRFQIPIDNIQKGKLEKTLNNLENQIRTGTEFYSKVQELKQLLESFDDRKYLKMFQYRCDKCEEVFDKKQGIGVHHKMNPNCTDEEPWDYTEPTYTKIRVDNQ